MLYYTLVTISSSLYLILTKSIIFVQIKQNEALTRPRIISLFTFTQDHMKN